MNRQVRLACGTVVAAGVLWSGATALAAEAKLQLSVKVAAPGGKAVPVCAKIAIPAVLAGGDAEKLSATVAPEAGGGAVPGQVILAGNQAELWWILPEAPAGATRWVATLSTEPYKGSDAFAFEDTAGKHLDLKFAGRPVTRYMYEFDNSAKDKAHDTYKPFTHVFDAAGKDFITKGAGGHDTHHRGIFIGWSKTGCGGSKYEFWGMGGGSAQVHRKFLKLAAGPVLGRCTDLVEWVDKDGKVIVSEERQQTCYRQGQDALMLMDFRSAMKAVAGDVALEGDPEHAGMQFRAHNDVAVQVGAVGGKQTADAAPEALKTIFEFHKDGIKTPGQKLNENTDLPWAAASYALRGKRYSVQHMNLPTNPKGTIYSAYRQYCRFGAYFKTTIPAGQTLAVAYRLYAVETPMPPRDEMNLRHAAFANPPVAEAAK